MDFIKIPPGNPGLQAGVVDETIVLDELNGIARQMILDRHPEIEITGKITLSEVSSFRGMEIMEVSREGVV